ncbi:MAG: thiamine pyrophosphate-binding protein [Deltaproteobacteria bacterium]|nr:thiamine pyrophosphate-binding protein [Deltaproteobacteria bacterium]
MNDSVTGGGIIAAMLRAEGVKKYFGIVDGTYLGLVSGCRQEGISLVTPRHESIAAHMAGAYARLTGGLGVCIASNGPGVANMLPGVAVENGEGNRVLLITSSRRTPISYPDRGGAYQYLNQVGVIKPMAKWSGCADSFERVAELTRRALRKCWTGRPGVVHLDVPENIMNGKTKPLNLPGPTSYRNHAPLFPAPDLVERAADLLAGAKLPLIHCGGGVIHAQAFEELARLAELLQAPVTTSWGARGVLPETSPLAWPMMLIKAVNQLRNAADVSLVLGSRLGETDWWGKPPYWAPPSAQKMIQVDLDGDILGLNRPADLMIQADLKLFLQQVIARLEEMKERLPLAERREALVKLTLEKNKIRAKLDEALADTATPLNTAHVAHVCRQVFDPDAVVVFDGGNTAVWGNFYHTCLTPNTQLSTHHFGHLGAGVGQALGAAVARPHSEVYCIIGDGAMGFHPQEIETAVRNKLKVIFLVCCDRQWGMVKMNQSFALKPLTTMVKKSLPAGDTINTDLGEIAFDKLAQAMGGHGERVTRLEELRPAIERARQAPVATVIHIEVDPVKHMWAPGLIHFKAMHQEPKGR